MEYYKNRIKWIRSQLLELTQKQIRDKAFLRQPHTDKSSYVQWQVIERSYKISALLIMLNDAKNKVRPPEKQKNHSQHRILKWGQYQMEIQIGKFTTALDAEHPHPKLYVIVDSGMTPIQKGIQGAHAVVNLFKQCGIQEHSALVFLESDNLRGLQYDLHLAKIKAVEFREPDWKNKLTAIALKPIEADQVPEWILSIPLAASASEGTGENDSRRIRAGTTGVLTYEEKREKMKGTVLGKILGVK